MDEDEGEVIMRILMLNYEFPPLGGGAGNANHYLLKELSKVEGLQIDLVTSSAGDYSVEKFSSDITIYKLDVSKKDVHFWRQKEIVSWLFKAYSLSRKLVSRNEYDYCHCWFGFPCGLVGMLLGIPYLVALRGSDVPGYNKRFGFQYVFLKPLIKRIWSKADKVVANSDDLKDLAHLTSDVKIDVIPNGVDVSEFKAVGGAFKGKLVSTGRLIPRKGYKYLIEALSKVDGFELTLIGEGNQTDELKALASELDVKVNFIGYVEHSLIADEYRKADVFVMLSLNEGLSNSLLEAMSCGLPVIVTDTGGVKDIVDGNGIVVEKESSLSIVDALKKLDTENVEKMGVQSRKIAEKMSWGAVADKYLRLYG